MDINDSIPVNEYNRIKNKLLIRTFVSIPITISFAVYLYSSLIQGEMVSLNKLLNGIVVVLITVSIMWIIMNTDKQIKKEKQREIKKKDKSKKRIAIECGLIFLLLIVLIVYAL
ncbi:hypothetical protein [Lentibacillus jeotgali]|uniref:hypothetical protein n=1 Tax=Lentibacillus jeotgali TaxID=558169 RepID=UPI000262782B|nr:hypothetical protein [Lentibacillus jeotgali]